MRAIHIFTGSDGHSHFKEGYIHNHTQIISQNVEFVESPAFSHLDWHNAPNTQFVITLKGELEFTTHSGQAFVLKPGDVLIANDLNGTGHKWKLTNTEPWQRVYCVFADDLQIDTFFKEIL